MIALVEFCLFPVKAHCDAAVCIGMDINAVRAAVVEEFAQHGARNALAVDDLMRAAVIEERAVAGLDIDARKLPERELFEYLLAVIERPAGAQDKEIACGAPASERVHGAGGDGLLTVQQCAVEIGEEHLRLLIGMIERAAERCETLLRYKELTVTCSHL